jgi:hypothetical protein
MVRRSEVGEAPDETACDYGKKHTNRYAVKFIIESTKTELVYVRRLHTTVLHGFLRLYSTRLCMVAPG